MIVLFDGIGHALEGGRRMIKFACNLDAELWMSRDSVIIDRDPAIGRNEFAVFRKRERINFQRARFDGARSSK